VRPGGEGRSGHASAFGTEVSRRQLIVQDVAAYQKLRQMAAEARVLEGIRQGIEDMNAGRTVSLDEFKEHARTKHGIKA